MPRRPADSTGPLSQSAYRDLRRRIVNGDLAPGQRLSLRSVASSLGMSMAPVGDAFRELNRDGLLEMEPGWGARVRRLDAESLRSQHILRIAIECEAIRQCTVRAVDAQIDALETLATNLDKLIDTQAEPKKVFELDGQFHLRVAQLSDAVSLVETLRTNQFVRMLVTRDSMAAYRRKLKSPLRRHLALVKAIRSRDPDRAELAMREHCVWSMELQLAHLAVALSEE